MFPHLPNLLFSYEFQCIYIRSDFTENKLDSILLHTVQPQAKEVGFIIEFPVIYRGNNSVLYKTIQVLYRNNIANISAPQCKSSLCDIGRYFINYRIINHRFKDAFEFGKCLRVHVGSRKKKHQVQLIGLTRQQRNVLQMYISFRCIIGHPALNI